MNRVVFNIIMLMALCAQYCHTYNIDVSQQAVTTVKIGTSNNSAIYAGKQIEVTRNNRQLRILIGSPLSAPNNGGSGAESGSIWECTANITGHKYDWITTPKCQSILKQNDLPTERPNHVLSGGGLGGSLFSIGSDEQVVCAAARQSKCGTIQATPGACYRGKIPNRLQWIDWKTESCYSQRYDIMFLIDSSGSISDGEFNVMKKVMGDIMVRFASVVGVNTRVGILQYGQNNPFNLDYSSSLPQYYRQPAKFGDCGTYQCLQKKIGQMNHIKAANTYTATAIERLAKIDFKSSTAQKILILITDGDATDWRKLGASYALTSAQNIVVWAVGVGSGTDQSQLKTSANGGVSNERVLNAANFNDLSVALNEIFDVETLTSEGSANDTLTKDKVVNTLYGFSGHKTKDDQLVISAVGMYGNAGSLTKFQTISQPKPTALSYQNVTSDLPIKNVEENDLYLGYVVTSGNFNGGTTTYVTSSAPKYLLHGAVVLYKVDTIGATTPESYAILPHNCTTCPQNHRQSGSFYGGSLLSVDVNGDGIDDLLVGAPLFVGDNYDEGRVFVYIAQGIGNLTQWTQKTYAPTELWGHKKTGGRFGTAMTSAGDVNSDGYNDVIISAPYAESGKGVIYLYHGSSSGITNTIQQTIAASSLADPGLRIFGRSLYGGLDVDNDDIPDLVVGSPSSDRLTFLRTRPVVTFNATFRFTSKAVKVIECLENRNDSCVILTLCFDYSGKSVETNIVISVFVTIDAQFKRVEIANPNVVKSSPSNYTTNINLSYNTTTCMDLNALPNIQLLSNVDSPIIANLSYSLPTSHTEVPKSSIEKRGTNQQYSATIPIDNGCAGDQGCEYDLSVDGKLELPKVQKTRMDDGTLLIAERNETTTVNTIKVKVNFTNSFDYAYGTKITISYSAELVWMKIINILSSNEENLRCVRHTSVATTSKQVLTYDDPMLQATMPNDTWCYFEVVFSYESLDQSGLVTSVNISVKVDAEETEGGGEIDDFDNTWNKTIPVMYVANSTLRDQTPETDIPVTFVNTAINVSSITDIGKDIPDVVIRTEVISHEVSTIPKSNLGLKYPSQLNHEYHNRLLYLYEVTCTASGGATCTCDQTNVDPERILSLNGTTNVTFFPNPTTLPGDTLKCTSNSSDGNVICETLYCNILNLGKNDIVHLEARFRICTHTLHFSWTQKQVEFLSEANHSVSDSPVHVDEAGQPLKELSHTITTTALKYEPATPPPLTGVATWIIVLSVILGVLFLAAISFGLKKKGFFEESEEEKAFKDAQWQTADDDSETNGPLRAESSS